MPRGTFADLLRDWQALLDDIGEHLPLLDLERGPLSEALNELRELRDIQKGLVGARRRVTRRQWEVRKQGKEQARRLKGLLTWYRGIREKTPASPEPTETPSKWTRSAKLKDWQRLLTALQENHADLPHLELHRAQLGALLQQAEELVQTQAALESIKQGTTRQLSELLSDGQRLATVLRYSVKQHYGPSAEKLEDFGIQPLRSRKLAEAGD